MSNNFAQFAPYKAPTKAHHLMWLYLSKLDAFSEDPDPVVIPVTEIDTFLFAMSQANGRSSAKERWGGGRERVEEAVKALASVTVGILDPDIYPDGGTGNSTTRRHELYRSFFPMFSKIPTRINARGDLCYEFVPNPELKRYIFQVIGKNYTKFMPYAETQVSQKHACRLYPALKSRFSSQRSRTPAPFYEVSVEALRRLLQIGEGEYTKIYDFWRYVVVSAVDDINQNSSLRVDAQQIKRGRKLERIRFYVTENDHTRRQLKLAVSNLDRERLTYLERMTRTKVWEIDPKEFGSWFPKELAAIKQRARVQIDELNAENREAGGASMTEKAYAHSLEAAIRNGMGQFAREEVAAAANEVPA